VSKDDGGPVFPQSYRVPGDSRIVECSGMSLHDWYVSHAPEWWVKEKAELLAKLEHERVINDSSRTSRMHDTVFHVVQAQLEYADAMIEAKKRRET